MRVHGAIAALGLALVGLGCEEPRAAEDPSVAITPLRLPAVELARSAGEAVPAFEGVTLVHFWATWCSPCRRELPGLLRLADEVESVRVVAVTDEPWSAVEAFFAPDDVPRWIARDREGELARALGVGALPDTYVVDARGVARRRVAGPRDWADPAIRAWVQTLEAPRPR